MTKKVLHIPQHSQVSSTPATPSAGFSKIYPKSDKEWYWLDDAGNENPFKFPIYSQNILYVDATYGNNSTGTAGRIDLPYSDIASAIGAASSGQTVVVRPGSYTEGAINLVDGVNIYCQSGVILSNTGFRDNGVTLTSNIYGDAKFTGSTAALAVSGASSIYLEFDTIDSSNFVAILNPASGTSVTRMVGNSIVCSGVNGFAISARGPAKLWLTVREYFESNHTNLFFRSGTQGSFSGEAYITCPLIKCTGTSTYAFNVCVSFSDVTSAAIITVRGDLETTSSSYGGGVNACLNGRGGNVTLYGNIKSVDSYGVTTDGNVSPANGIIKIYGSIYSNREAISSNSSTVPIYVQGGLISSTGIGTIPVTVRTGAGYSGLPAIGGNTLYFKDCRFYNSLNNGSLVDIYPAAAPSASTAYFYDCEGTSAGASGNFCQASAAATAGFKNTVSNKTLSSVTDLFSPSGFVLDVSGSFTIPNF